MSLFKSVLQNNEKKKSTSNDVLFSNTNKKVLTGEKTKKTITGSSSISKVVSQKEPTINYRLYKNKVFDSINVEEEYFTNFLPDFEALDGYIKIGLDKLKSTPTLLSHTESREEADSIRMTGEFKNRTENIISHYDDLNESDGDLVKLLYDGFIRKSKIKTPLGDNGALRLISVYSKDIDEDTTYFDLLFIDFYHLFIPSKHNGLGARENALKVYESRKKCDKTVHKHIKVNIFE